MYVEVVLVSLSFFFDCIFVSLCWTENNFVPNDCYSFAVVILDKINLFAQTLHHPSCLLGCHESKDPPITTWFPDIPSKWAADITYDQLGRGGWHVEITWLVSLTASYSSHEHSTCS